MVSIEGASDVAFINATKPIPTKSGGSITGNRPSSSTNRANFVDLRVKTIAATVPIELLTTAVATAAVMLVANAFLNSSSPKTWPNQRSDTPSGGQTSRVPLLK